MRAIFIKGSAGTGKTERALRAIAESSNKPWEYYAPTHKLSVEAAARLAEVNSTLRIAHICGRDHKPDGQNCLCKKIEQANQLVEAGLSVFPLLCHQRIEKDKPPLKCEHFDQCGYTNQFGNADVFFYTHAHLSLERSFLENHHPHGVFIDETHVIGLVESVSFSVALLTDRCIPEPAKALCAKLAETLISYQDKIRSFVNDAIASGEWRKARKSLRQTSSGIKPDMPAEDFSKAVKRVKSLRPVSMLFEHLGQSTRCKHTPQSVLYDHEKRIVTVHHRHDISKRFRQQNNYSHEFTYPQFYILDASASELIANRLFDECKVKTIPVQRTAHVIQYVYGALPTSSLVPYQPSKKDGAKRPTRQSISEAKSKRADINRLIVRLLAAGAKFLVVGPRSLVGNPENGIKPKLKRIVGVDYAHFGSLRGLDCYKNHDAVIVIGRNQPPVSEVERIARGMFYDDPVPLKLTGQWTTERRGYRLKNGERGVDVEVHPDKRVQEVVHLIREEETVQALDRLRLVFNGKPKIVYLLSNLPVDVEVDELRSWQEIIHGGNRLELAWDRLDAGVLPLAPAWLVERFPDLWPTGESARKGVRRDMAGLSRTGQSPNSIFIRGLSALTYQYRPPGQKRWSECLSSDPDLASNQEALQKLLGADIAVRECRS